MTELEEIISRLRILAGKFAYRANQMQHMAGKLEKDMLPLEAMLPLEKDILSLEMFKTQEAKPGKRTISPEGRKRISVAQRKRWLMSDAEREERKREIHRLRSEEHLTVKEIAERLKITEGSVSNALYKHKPTLPSEAKKIMEGSKTYEA